jgi:hypothetical protein
MIGESGISREVFDNLDRKLSELLRLKTEIEGITPLAAEVARHQETIRSLERPIQEKADEISPIEIKLDEYHRADQAFRAKASELVNGVLLRLASLDEVCAEVEAINVLLESNEKLKAIRQQEMERIAVERPRRIEQVIRRKYKDHLDSMDQKLRQLNEALGSLKPEARAKALEEGVSAVKERVAAVGSFLSGLARKLKKEKSARPEGGPYVASYPPGSAPVTELAEEGDLEEGRDVLKEITEIEGQVSEIRKRKSLLEAQIIREIRDAISTKTEKELADEKVFTDRLVSLDQAVKNRRETLATSEKYKAWMALTPPGKDKDSHGVRVGVFQQLSESAGGLNAYAGGSVRHPAYSLTLGDFPLLRDYGFIDEESFSSTTAAQTAVIEIFGSSAEVLEHQRRLDLLRPKLHALLQKRDPSLVVLEEMRRKDVDVDNMAASLGAKETNFHKNLIAFYRAIADLRGLLLTEYRGVTFSLVRAPEEGPSDMARLRQSYDAPVRFLEAQTLYETLLSEYNVAHEEKMRVLRAQREAREAQERAAAEAVERDERQRLAQIAAARGASGLLKLQIDNPASEPREQGGRQPLSCWQKLVSFLACVFSCLACLNCFKRASTVLPEETPSPSSLTASVMMGVASDRRSAGSNSSLGAAPGIVVSQGA